MRCVWKINKQRWPLNWLCHLSSHSSRFAGTLLWWGFRWTCAPALRVLLSRDVNSTYFNYLLLEMTLLLLYGLQMQLMILMFTTSLQVSRKEEGRLSYPSMTHLCFARIFSPAQQIKATIRETADDYPSRWGRRRQALRFLRQVL